MDLAGSMILGEFVIEFDDRKGERVEQGYKMVLTEDTSHNSGSHNGSTCGHFES